MKCKQCGFDNVKAKKFCGNCGAAIVPPKPFYKKPAFLVPVISVALALTAVGGIFLGQIIEKNNEPEETREHKIIRHTESTNSSRATNTPTPEPTPTVVETTHRTVMVYMIGSNLESESGLATQDIEEILDAEINDDINIIIQTGGTETWQHPLIEDRKVQRFKVTNGEIEELQNLGDVSMVEQSTLTDFIQYSASHFEADNYTLVMWNHGGSIPIGFGSDEIHRGTLDDVEIGNALRNSGVHFDALVFNACEMCSLELFMSIKDSVDYVVAAESVLYGYNIYGSGIDYQSWLALACQADVTAQDFCETILDDYMLFLDSISTPGSMSVIRMDRVDEVYAAYCDYIAEVGNGFDDNDYAEFILARESCGSYEGTDSVDISTLATKYENSYSTALQNAVTNAVVRTQSDIPYGHGITAYSPYQYPEFYSWGRESFVALNYDENVIAFYDLLASKLLYYNNETAYAGDWYIDQSNTTINHAQKVSIDYTDMGDYLAVALSTDDWNTVTSVEMWVCQDFDDPDLLYIYGMDEQYTYDSNHYIKVTYPLYWLKIANYIPTSLCLEYEITDDGWYQVSLVYAKVNGEDGFLRVECNQDDNNGRVVGFYACGFDNTNPTDLRALTDEDEIQLVVITLEDSEITYRPINQTFSADELEVTWPRIDFADSDVIYVYYVITDVYGNTYETDMTLVNN